MNVDIQQFFLTLRPEFSKIVNQLHMKPLKTLPTVIISLCILTISCRETQPITLPATENSVTELLYKEAATYQKEGRWDEAISAYLEIICTEPQDDAQNNDIIAESILQLMNTCQSEGEQDECVNILERIQANPTEYVRENLWRDLKSIYAYALYRADKDELALEVMEEALAMEYEEVTDRRLFRDYSYAAAIVYSNPKKQDDAVRYCQAALEAAERASMDNGVQWTASILGRLYMKNGMMFEALELYKTSVVKSKKIGDISGLANAYNSLSEIFVFWDYPEEAICYSDSALLIVDEVRLRAASVAGDTYRIRSKAKELTGQTDSALYYLNKAEVIYEVLPYNSGNDECDMAMGSILIKSNDPESRQSGIRYLERVIEKATRLEPRAAAYANLARLYDTLGDAAKHDEMMEGLLLMIRQDPENITYINEEVCRYALEHFMSEGNVTAAEIFSKLYIQQVDRRSADNVSRAIASASQKEMDIMHRKEMEKTVSRTTLLLTISFTIIAVIMLTSYIIIRLRHKKTNALVTGLKKNNRKLADELSNMTQSIEIQNITDAALLPQIFRKNGESAFRERFETLYPDFIPSLRTAVPHISRNEEILCMMIFLNQDLNQIAYNMGIEKTSVNQARYRLRKKMGLQKEDSLKEKVLKISDIK